MHPREIAERNLHPEIREHYPYRRGSFDNYTFAKDVKPPMTEILPAVAGLLKPEQNWQLHGYSTNSYSHWQYYLDCFFYDGVNVPTYKTGKVFREKHLDLARALNPEVVKPESITEKIWFPKNDYGRYLELTPVELGPLKPLSQLESNPAIDALLIQPNIRWIHNTNVVEGEKIDSVFVRVALIDTNYFLRFPQTEREKLIENWEGQVRSAKSHRQLLLGTISHFQNAADQFRNYQPEGEEKKALEIAGKLPQKPII